MIAATLFRDYLDVLKDAATDAGVTLATMLGYPEEGRPMPTLPILALAFANDDYQGRNRHVRLGETRPQGIEISATIMLIAENEYQLLQLVDFLRDIKQEAAGITVGSDAFVVTYDTTRRVPFGVSEILHHAAETAVLFRLYLK